ncbi:nuclease [Halapricum sp. CBA1109]|uniref:DNA double-strand break repair nuclease NurA n=1 Tax=Halapricum sp. CBA1109 TaxID=2668068 RepID=UPI0012FAE62E|nr:DNA double-strand break repair nuclease NurA [Halapricum sp. CBA1109]MUV89013.1 nuclease [Halapricum sp. CBA1109]
MTLDPVHVDGIAQLATLISQRVADTDHRALAETVWEDFLDPLYVDDQAVLTPMDEQVRRRVDVQDVALRESPFPTQHGLDSGTINPTTFENGLVLDVAQAAMSAVPSDMELHRARTVVMTAHANDVTVDVGAEDWIPFDEGYTRRRILQVPRVDRYAQTVVHALALYLAESHHALLQADVVEDLLVLDGPIYPTGILKWTDRHPELADLLADHETPQTVVENYLDLVDRFVERDVPLIGFVKNSSANAITRAVRSKTNAPWANDTALFSRILECYEDGEQREDVLTYTNWFRSRLGTDRLLSEQGSDVVDMDDRPLDRGAYEVTFFAVYDPRTDLLFRVEAPAAFTTDPDLRERLTMQVLRDVAAEQGPPLAVAKADELAKIDRQGKEMLTRTIEQRFDSERQRTYNDERWGVSLEDMGV